MGTACICYKQQKQTEQLITIEQLSISVDNQRFSSSAKGRSKKFMDIRDGSNEQQLSQLNLNIMNAELSRCLVQYQTKNGKITHRFTQRIIQQNQNESGLALFDRGFERDKENVNYSQKQNQLYLPLTNQNAESEISQSNNSQREADKSNNKSCLLSQSSRILNGSLFTQRAQQKQRFYSVYNKLGETILEKWNDNNRLSYEYEKDQIQALKLKYFDSKFIACLYSLYQYWETHFIHLLTYSKYPTGFKIYINGDKKMLPILSQNSSEVSLIDVYEGLIQKLKPLDIANLTYILTGWMPERIYLTQIKNFEGILERLATNLIEGNTLITFTRQTKLGEQYATLVKIDFENGLIYLNSNNKRNTIPDLLLQYKNQSKNEIGIKFYSFVELYDVINLNWNPYIYQLSQTCQGILNEQNRSKKFMLVIPSSSQDLQIRLFLQRHQNFMDPSQFGIMINLYEYNGTSDVSDCQPIRTMETDEAIYSDVFIFQYCKDKTQYLLSVQIKQGQQCTQDVYFTIALYSFAQMKFKTLQQKPCLEKTNVVAKISEENIGFGINSPYFNKNLQFSVQTEVGGQLEIVVSATNNVAYEICLIPDPQKQRNLTKLRLENIINKSQISGDKNGKGSFFIKTTFNQYMLMINAYQAAEQFINIELKFYGKRENYKEQLKLKIDQVQQNYKPIFTHDIKWLPTHFGPRKRLKSNSNSQFQPLSVFSQFFKNPLVDKKLIKGTYQFYIKSETFREYFDSVQSHQDKNACQPPALSMAIFQASQDKKLYKIIFDDAFYVPFGVGFWTSSIELQEGTYRFILPKIDKGFSKGTFGIIKN